MSLVGTSSLAGRAQLNMAPFGVGAKLTDFLGARRQLSAIFIPVEHQIDLSHRSSMGIQNTSSGVVVENNAEPNLRTRVIAHVR